MEKIFIPLERIDIDNIPLRAAKEEIIRCNAEIVRLNKLLAAQQGVQSDICPVTKKEHNWWQDQGMDFKQCWDCGKRR